MTSTPTFFSIRYSIAFVICLLSPLMMATVPPMGESCTMVISAKMMLSETVEHLRHGGDDRLVDVALNIGQADDELAGLETRDGGILGDELFDLLEVRGRVDEALRDVLLGLSEDREDLALLDDAAVFHDGDAVTDLLDDSHLVRDGHDRDAERFVEVLEKVQDRLRCRGIERGGRLVAQKHLWVVARARAMATRCFCPPESWLG